MRLWAYLTEDVWLEGAPQVLDRLPRSGSSTVDTSSTALKEKRRQIGDLDARGVVAMNDAGSLDDARIRAADELHPMMSMNGSDQGRVRATDLVENQQAPIVELLALALQARQESVNGSKTSKTQIASSLPRPCCRHKRNRSTGGLDCLQP